MHEYKDLGTLTKVACVALVIYMVTRLVMLGTSFWAYGGVGLEATNRALALAAAGPVLFLIAFIACVIIIGRWIYRASANAHALSDEMTISPAGAVGWYFVPIMNLFKPYQAMREIWLASHFRGNWHGEPSPSLVGIWWALWIVVNILDNVTSRLTDSDGRLLEGGLVFEAIAALLTIALCVVLINLMRQIARAQSNAPYEETFA